MSANTPPPAVLIARIEHELTSAGLYVGAGTGAATRHIRKAQDLLAQLKEAMK
jgi:hypothetical protein